MFHAAKTNHSAVSKFAFKSTDIEHVRCKTPVGSFSDESFSVMRSHFPDEEDESLARFLIARNGDTSKAIPFLTKSIEWRTKKLPLQIPSFYREFIKGKIYMHGHDKTGHPLLVYRGRLNFAKEREIDEMINMSIYWMEKAVESLPDDKSQITFLFDRTGSTAENVDLDFLKALAAVMQDNYPERLHKIVVHPVGILFYAGWSLAKLFVDKNTQEKVQPMLYFTGVQQYIDDQFIPSHMGGTCNFVFTGKEVEKQEHGPAIQKTILAVTPGAEDDSSHQIKESH